MIRMSVALSFSVILSSIISLVPVFRFETNAILVGITTDKVNFHISCIAIKILLSPTILLKTDERLISLWSFDYEEFVANNVQMNCIRHTVCLAHCLKNKVNIDVL